MPRNLVLIIFCLALWQCRQEPVEKHDTVLTTGQQAIIRDYNSTEKYLNKPADSLEVFANSLFKRAGKQPPVYRALSQIVLGITYARQSKYQLGYKHFENALALAKSVKNDSLKARALSGIGAYYTNVGDYPKALETLLVALGIYEQIDDVKGLVTVNGLIGIVYMQKNDPALAKEHLLRALEQGKNIRHKLSYLTAAHTLANVYGISGDYAKALEVDEKALEICDSAGQTGIKNSFLDNKANCFLYMGKLDSAAYYFNECLQIDMASGNPKFMADTYSNLAHLETMRGNFPSAEAYIKKAFALARDIKNSHNILKCHQIEVTIYKDWGKKDLAIKAQEDYISAYATVMDEKKEMALAEFRIVHETEKKEKIIAQNRIALLQKDTEVRNRNSLIVIISLFAIFLGLILLLVYRQQLLKNRQQFQEHELKTAIGRIETQNKLQQQRLDISRDLHDNIGSQLTFVISSVDNLRYAFDLKGSKIDEKLQHISQFTQSTIIELRDTIWAMNQAEISFEDLRTRIYNFIEKARLARQDISFSFEIDATLRELKVTSVQGMNIYRSIQEAVNNAIKHSRASHVEVAIKREDDDVEIVITDNGVGFDQATIHDGNGLGNIKKRITDIGGAVTVQSSPAGVRLQISIGGLMQRLKNQSL